MSGAYLLVPLTLASAVLCGVLLVLPTGLRSALAQRLGIGESQVDLLTLVLQGSLLLFLPLSGILVDALGIEMILIGGSLLAGFSLALLALRTNFAAIAGIMVALGAASAALLASATVLMTRAFFPDRAAAALNLGSIFVVLGGVLAPPLVEIMLGGLRFRRTLLALALCCLAPAFLAALTPVDVFWPDGGRAAPSDAWTVVSQPSLWLAAVILLLYGPIEAAIPRWATTNLVNLGVSSRRASWYLFGFWMAFLLARLLAALLLHTRAIRPGVEPWLILFLGLAVGVALGNR